MVQLVDGDIKTREVLDWKGVHVLHFMGSSCSQKLRIFLNLKGIEWESHHVDLRANENFQPWFLGINPRGLVPVLVHNGSVHIESNDIIQYLEQKFPSPRLIPAGLGLGAEVPRRPRRTRPPAGTTSLPDGRQFERARHRLVDLRPSAGAGRLPARAAPPEKLRARPEFAKEIAMSPEAVTRLEATRRSQVEAGKTLEAVAGF